MKNFVQRFLAILVLYSIWQTCSREGSSEVVSKESAPPAAVAVAGLSPEYLGNYTGHQKQYYMYNESGQELVINGQKIPVPPIDFLFTLKENRQAALEQTNLEDHMQYSYEGSYEVLDSLSDTIKLRLSLKDRTGSEPIFDLEIRKSDKVGTCSSAKEPTFVISKEGM